MVKQTSVNLDITSNADGFDVSGGTTSRKLTLSGADVAIAGSGSAVITFPGANATLAILGANTFTDDQTIGANNIIMTGSIADTDNRVTKGWFTNLECTNLPTINGGTLTTALSLGTMASETATDYVAKALFDANTILYATDDNTPATLSVTEQTLVGRLTGGNISAVAIGIADNNVLQIDDADAAENDYCKLTTIGVVGRSYAEVLSDIGAAPTTSPTFATSITGSYLTASEILITDANKKIVSAPVATYPSLTELSYVKGVSSAIQTQLGNKLANVVEDTTPELGGEMDCGAHSIGFTQQSSTGDGTTTIDWKLGNKYYFTFGAQSDTFTFTAPSNPCNLLLVLKQDGTGSRTATWPVTVMWPGGTAPTLSTDGGSIDIISFYYDGTYYHGVASLDFSVPA